MLAVILVLSTILEHWKPSRIKLEQSGSCIEILEENQFHFGPNIILKIRILWISPSSVHSLY